MFLCNVFCGYVFCFCSRLVSEMEMLDMSLPTKERENVDQLVDEFNEWLSPELCYAKTQRYTHRQLLQLIDKKQLIVFRKQAEIEDMARIKCLAVSGTASWLTVTPWQSI